MVIRSIYGYIDTNIITTTPGTQNHPSNTEDNRMNDNNDNVTRTNTKQYKSFEHNKHDASGNTEELMLDIPRECIRLDCDT